jgi:hypothetical protein
MHNHCRSGNSIILNYMPRRGGTYLIVAIRTNFSIVDFNSNLDGNFILRNR